MDGRSATGWFHELFRFGFYKRNQGRIARQATFGALAVIVVLGAWKLTDYMGSIVGDHPQWSTSTQNTAHYFLPLFLLGVGLWASFRVVQMPAFAEFLISVENEMNKVSWPARGELFRASLVVILVIFFLAALLFAYDAILTAIVGPGGLLDKIVNLLFG